MRGVLGGADCGLVYSGWVDVHEDSAVEEAMTTVCITIKGQRMTIVVPKLVALSDGLWQCVMDGPNSFTAVVALCRQFASSSRR